MRCLYCEIKLKIAEKAKRIEHCPECSEKIACEGRSAAAPSAQGGNASVREGSNRRVFAAVAMKSA
jgi:DNA-directed RNA polymerase subunit RPC12/RpoP